jgi:hypothetical protein
MNNNSEFNKKFNQIINKQSIKDNNFFIQDKILFIFNRHTEDTDTFDLPMLQNLITSSKDSFKAVMNILTEEQQYNISPIENDDYEDGIYVQINGKEITVGVMLSLENINSTEEKHLSEFLLSKCLSRGI